MSHEAMSIILRRRHQARIVLQKPCPGLLWLSRSGQAAVHALARCIDAERENVERSYAHHLRDAAVHSTLNIFKSVDGDG